MAPEDRPLIVGIGASAGGLAALQQFFQQIPVNTGASFVVVMHLDPTQPSQLAHILSGSTTMSVVPVEATTRVEPNQVYVIPPDRRLEFRDYDISALPLRDRHAQRSAIDTFFRSMAERLGDGFAVILSGAGSDGAAGVKAVKESGGIILVQDPIEAEHDSMPRSAVATGVADFVLPVRDIAARLIDLISVRKQNAHPELDEKVDDWLRRIFGVLRSRTGHDFSNYKQSTMLRRINRRMNVVRAEHLQGYYDVLRQREGETDRLLSDLLISVTNFFRDPDAFEALARQCLPHFFEDDEPVRVWSAGCATGEEAYSLAILLLEEAERHKRQVPVQVFGSDLDLHALTIAREGWYPAAIETDVTEARLQRFFLRDGAGYRVRQELRDVVLFAAHDLFKDPPFSHLYLIVCRNLLIYLDRTLQEQAFRIFHYSLRSDGKLMLGASETIDDGRPNGGFHSFDRTARIYQPIGSEERATLPMVPTPTRARPLAPISGLANTDVARHRAAIERVAPPSILVDTNYRMVHLSDSAGRYIAPSGGSPTLDVVDMVRPELRFELRSALNRAFEQGRQTLSLSMPVLLGEREPIRVFLLIKPFHDERANQTQAVVMFIEGPPIDQAAATEPSSNATVKQLMEELQLAEQRLRAMRGESESANEDLRAANEELQSMNEEYRATSEELETSREELQSINEELQTVNTELKLKLDAVSRAHNDLQNLMAATEVATLFLDANLRIRRFNEQLTELFSIISPTDEGRCITDFSSQLDYDDLPEDAENTLAHLTPLRREVRSRAGGCFDVRMRPYRTIEDKIDGVVISFIDVTERRQMEEELRLHERMSHALVELSWEPILVWNFADKRIVAWNAACEKLYGVRKENAIGHNVEELLGEFSASIQAALSANGTWTGQQQQTTRDGRIIAVGIRLQLLDEHSRKLVLETVKTPSSG